MRRSWSGSVGRVVVAVVAAAVVVGGWTSSWSTSAALTDAAGVRTASSTGAVGVTPKQVKVGVALIDYSCIKSFVDTIRTHEDKVYRAFIDDVNKKGGMAGRKIVPVFESFCPVQSAGVLAACTKLTEDDKVFAVIGSFYDLSGDAQGCVAKQHQRVLMAFNLTQQIIDKSPPGMIIYPGATNERAAVVLVDLLKKNGKFKGKKVAVLGGSQESATVNQTIVPALKKAGVPLGTTAVLSITGTDTTAAQAQLDSFIERWKSEHVNGIFLSGDEVSSKQFVTKIRSEMPNVALYVDNTDERGAARDEVRAGVKPNPYEGMLAAGGPTSAEYVKGPNWAYCKAIYKKQTGKKAPSPQQTIKGPGGKTLDLYQSINDACQMVSMFHDVGQRVGKNLNNANWVKTVDHFGPITNRGSGPYSSLGTGKYDAEDSFRLEQFDSSIAGGDWKPLTPVQNVPGS
jgi:hypothetical protein